MLFLVITSASPERRIVKRVLPVPGLNDAAFGSLKIAAAKARHRSMSKPFQTPLSSGFANPVRPGLTTHCILPLDFYGIKSFACGINRTGTGSHQCCYSYRCKFLEIHDFPPRGFVTHYWVSEPRGDTSGVDIKQKFFFRLYNISVYKDSGRSCDLFRMPYY